jgi:hypothetical protein
LIRYDQGQKIGKPNEIRDRNPDSLDRITTIGEGHPFLEILSFNYEILQRDPGRLLIDKEKLELKLITVRKRRPIIYNTSTL